MSERKDKSKRTKEKGVVEEKHKIRNIDEFKELIIKNNKHGRDWYHGLDGKWWWGMTEDQAIKYIGKGLVPEIEFDRIILVSTWNINCGIATYTKYLWDDLSKISNNSFIVNPINDGRLKHKIKSKGGLTHIQHEFGIIPTLPRIKGKVIITWHTISRNMNDTIKEFESNYDVIGHIVHSECARQDIVTSKDVWTVPHGSTLIPEMKKEDARRLLGININMPIGFVFGFQSGDKNYERLVEAAKKTGIHIIISGAPHHLINSESIENNRNVTFINRFLTEDYVNLYSLASDVLLFDYTAKDHFSVSGALHRIIGAGRPIVCSDIRHFSDIKHNENCLKFKNQNNLEKCIKRALDNSERLSLAARKYAEKTSWDKIAKQHVEIYKKYIDISSLQ